MDYWSETSLDLERAGTRVQGRWPLMSRYSRVVSPLGIPMINLYEMGFNKPQTGCCNLRKRLLDEPHREGIVLPRGGVHGERFAFHDRLDRS